MKRLFFAIRLDEKVRANLSLLTARLKPRLANVKWVDPALLHVTVKFLGNTPDAQLEDVLRIGAAAAAETPPISATVAGVGAFPALHKPRIVWAGLEEATDALVTLARTLDEQLEPLGFAGENRRFTAHITLGRARRKQRIPPMEELAQRYQSSDFGPLRAPHLTLFESQLTPTGPICTALQDFRLGSGD